MITTIFALYIPHGSDNTATAEDDNFRIQILYIPHGSDNTKPQQACQIWLRISLYIPHGSDNTKPRLFDVHHYQFYFISHMVQIILILWKFKNCRWPQYFISHMVQIIRAWTCYFSFCLPFFISHMVQIIPNFSTNSTKYQICSFISHMVQIIQWKLKSIKLVRINLYIPHGSDNTYQHWKKSQVPLIFISHMVQIIQTRRYEAFNWCANRLYIPHGSDNTKQPGE